MTATMNWPVWDEIETMLGAEALAPILAAVPDNQDEALKVAPPNEMFWERVRGWQARGWTIGMHGYQHRAITRDGGILGVNRVSEFAGLPCSAQDDKLRAGLAILHSQGIDSTVWIAPWHSFDGVILRLVRALGFSHVSDGFFALPHVDDVGLTWVPQQLWGFRWRPFGVWTICFHVNRWSAADLRVFREHIRRYRDRISTFPIVAALYRGRANAVLDAMVGRVYRSIAVMSSVARR